MVSEIGSTKPQTEEVLDGSTNDESQRERDEAVTSCTASSATSSVGEVDGMCVGYGSAPIPQDDGAAMQQQDDDVSRLPKSSFCRWQLQAAARPTAPHTVVGVVHPSGRMVWLPYQNEWTSVAMLRAEVAARWSASTADLRIVSQSGTLNDTDLIDQKCSPGEILFVLPRLPLMHLMEPAEADVSECLTELAPEVEALQFAQESDTASQAIQPEVVMQPGMTRIGGMHSVPAPTLSSNGIVATSPQSMMPLSGPCTPLSPPSHAPPPPQYTVVLTQASNSNPTQWMGGMSLEEKLQYASQNIVRIISQTKQCTELQSDMESAMRQGIDCSHVFSAMEAELSELILHPAGNYLVSRCFDFCPSLIETAAQMICRSIRQYCLHKHGSYVVEAIIEHRCTSPTARSSIIAQLISHQHRQHIAAHDSGNFVLQKAISCAPDSLLPHMVETVRAVQGVTPHGAKMTKKLDQRLQRSPNVDLRSPAVTTLVPVFQDTSKTAARHPSSQYCHDDVVLADECSHSAAGLDMSMRSDQSYRQEYDAAAAAAAAAAGLGVPQHTLPVCDVGFC